MRLWTMIKWTGMAAGAYYLYQNYVKPEMAMESTAPRTTITSVDDTTATPGL